jgi:hypothetical protein
VSISVLSFTNGLIIFQILSSKDELQHQVATLAAEKQETALYVEQLNARILVKN